MADSARKKEYDSGLLNCRGVLKYLYMKRSFIVAVWTLLIGYQLGSKRKLRK